MSSARALLKSPSPLSPPNATRKSGGANHRLLPRCFDADVRDGFHNRIDFHVSLILTLKRRTASTYLLENYKGWMHGKAFLLVL